MLETIANQPWTGLEYWVMAIYLPFGIALFQLNLAQIHGVSSEQKKLLSGWAFSGSIVARPNFTSFASQSGNTPQEGRPKESGIRGMMIRWTGMTPVQRIEFSIGVGLAVQVRPSAGLA
jgi:hypothetical protein